MVEAAFVTPIFFTLVLGVAEIGLAMNDYLALADSVRASARVASTTGSDIYSDWSILAAFNRESAALADRNIRQIVIYKPGGFGQAPTATCQSGVPVTNVCNVYDASDLQRPKTDFGCLSSQDLDRYWCPSNRKITLSGSGTDYVGVWVKIDHKWVTKMFGSDKTLTDSSVIRIEPRTK